MNRSFFAAVAAAGVLATASAPAYAQAPATPSRPEGLSVAAVGAILVAGGLAGGAAGFAILYACREGESCHGDATTALGWTLAAPGIPPLTVGLVLIAVGLNSDDGQAAAPVTFHAGSVPG